MDLPPVPNKPCGFCAPCLLTSWSYRSGGQHSTSMYAGMYRSGGNGCTRYCFYPMLGELQGFSLGNANEQWRPSPSAAVLGSAVTTGTSNFPIASSPSSLTANTCSSTAPSTIRQETWTLYMYVPVKTCSLVMYMYARVKTCSLVMYMYVRVKTCSLVMYICTSMSRRAAWLCIYVRPCQDVQLGYVYICTSMSRRAAWLCICTSVSRRAAWLCIYVRPCQDVQLGYVYICTSMSRCAAWSCICTSMLRRAAWSDKASLDGQAVRQSARQSRDTTLHLLWYLWSILRCDISLVNLTA